MFYRFNIKFLAIFLMVSGNYLFAASTITNIFCCRRQPKPPTSILSGNSIPLAPGGPSLQEQRSSSTAYSPSSVSMPLAPGGPRPASMPLASTHSHLLNPYVVREIMARTQEHGPLPIDPRLLSTYPFLAEYSTLLRMAGPGANDVANELINLPRNRRLIEQAQAAGLPLDRYYHIYKRVQ